MAENISAGAISLDLVIKNKIGEQLERIKRSAEGPASKVGKAIEKAISAPMEKAGKAVGKAVNEAVNEVVEDIDNTLDAATAAWDKYVKSLENANLPDMRDRMRTLELPRADASGVTEEIVKAADKLNNKVAETVGKTKEKLSELEDFEVASDPTGRMHQEIELVTEQLDLLQKKWQELSNADPTDKVISQINVTEQRIISTQNKLDGLKAKLYELENASPEIIPADTAIKAENAASSIKLSFIKGFAAIKSKAALVFNGIKNIGGKALNSLKSHFSSVGKSATSLMKPVSKLGRTLKNTFRRVFLMAGIYAAFRAIKDGLLEATKADKQFADSLNSVKANLAIAFQPILQAIMPALNTLMAGLAAVTKQVAGFIAGLFGSTYKQAAEATKKLKTTADAAKKAKMSMAGIDEMNVLSGDDSNTASDSGGVDYSKLDMSEPELPDWAEKLKESIKGGDWKGVGAILAERVNSAFSAINWDKISTKVNNGIGKITDVINGFLNRFTEVGGWETIGDTIAGALNTITSATNKFYDSIDWSTLGSGLATGLNEFVYKTNWDELGKSLSAKIRALIDTAFSFVSTFDFKSLGSGVGTAVNSWFANIDFKKLGKTVSKGIKGVLDTLISAIKKVDWQKIGESIYDALSNIDWGAIASGIFELLGAALGAAVSLLWGAIKNVIKSIGDFFTKEFERMDTGNIGLDIILGILVGIGDAVIGLGKWIYDHVLKPFIDGFTQVLPDEIWDGITSFFTDVADWFGEQFQAALDTVISIWTTAKEFFGNIWENIKNVFSTVEKWFKDKFNEALENVVAVWIVVNTFFQDIWDGIKETFSKVGTWFKNKFKEAWDNIKAIWTLAKTFFQKVWNGIKEVFSKVGEWFEEKFQQAIDNVKAVWSIVTNFFSGLWEDIKNVFSGVGTWFKDKFNEALDNIKAVFSGIGEFFSGIWDNIKGVFSDIGGKIGDAFSGAFKTVVNNVFEWIENKINGFIDMINGVIDLINNIPGVDLNYLDYLELPRLAKGGLATAPTLAMVGDNRNAKTDPEVISPLSKLQGMVGADPEIVELLHMIVELLKSGMNIEIINYLFKNSKEFSREVLNVVNTDKARRGQ